MTNSIVKKSTQITSPSTDPVRTDLSKHNPLESSEKTTEPHLHRIDALVTKCLEFIPLNRGFMTAFTTIVQPTLDNYSRIVASGAIPQNKKSISYHSYAWDRIAAPMLKNEKRLMLFEKTLGKPDVGVGARNR